MQTRIITSLKATKFSVPQTYKNVVVMPMTSECEGLVNYITLPEALEGHFLTVTELTQGGSVPELKVTNTGDVAVLLLDGEEVAGAKQNRVLNTTVLVPEKQSIVIPVSCTEQGRWAYATEAFYDSGTVMSRSIRAKKSRSVSASLDDSASFRSDQGVVWDGIQELHQAAGVSSPTASMRDVFEARKESLEDASKAFPLIPGQVGILVVVNGEAVGLDIVSRPAAYARLHGKLIKSYVMDAVVERKKAKADSAKAMAIAQAFLERAAGCEEKSFKSVGCGEDYRLKGDRLAGSALLYRDTVIHTAFFHLDAGNADGRMSRVNRRRSYRVY